MTKRGILISLPVCLLLALPAVAQLNCSTETVRGVWAHRALGWIVTMAPDGSGPITVPIAMLNLVTIDYGGRITGSTEAVVGGTHISGTGTGTIVVNPDCTAVAKFSITPAGSPSPMPGEGTTRLVILDDGNVMRGMTPMGQMGIPVGTEEYRRISRGWKGPPTCSLQTVRGTRALWYDGLILMTLPGMSTPSPVPVSILGVGSMDTSGATSGGATFNVGGQLMDVEFVDSSIVVNPDCTGEMPWRGRIKGATEPMPGTGLDKIIVLDGGDELWAMPVVGLLGQPAVLGVYKRLHKTALASNW